MTTEETIWYDDVFQVIETRYGLFISEMRDKRRVITSPDLKSCIEMTRYHLKGEQEGFPEPLTTYSGSIGGKL